MISKIRRTANVMGAVSVLTPVLRPYYYSLHLGAGAIEYSQSGDGEGSMANHRPRRSLAKRLSSLETGLCMSRTSEYCSTDTKINEPGSDYRMLVYL